MLDGLDVTSSSGPLTPFLTACATAAGAGIVLGGLAAGVAGLLRSWDGEKLDSRVRKGSYWGGVLGLTLLAFDYAVR